MPFQWSSEETKSGPQLANARNARGSPFVNERNAARIRIHDAQLSAESARSHGDHGSPPSTGRTLPGGAPSLTRLEIARRDPNHRRARAGGSRSASPRRSDRGARAARDDQLNPNKRSSPSVNEIPFDAPASSSSTCRSASTPEKAGSLGTVPVSVSEPTGNDRG